MKTGDAAAILNTPILIGSEAALRPPIKGITTRIALETRNRVAKIEIRLISNPPKVQRRPVKPTIQLRRRVMRRLLKDVGTLPTTNNFMNSKLRFGVQPVIVSE